MLNQSRNNSMCAGPQRDRSQMFITLHNPKVARGG